MKAKLKFAMVQDIVVAYQLIARHAAQGKDLAYLRMMADEADEGQAPGLCVDMRGLARCVKNRNRLAPTHIPA